MRLALFSEPCSARRTERRTVTPGVLTVPQCKAAVLLSMLRGQNVNRRKQIQHSKSQRFPFRCDCLSHIYSSERCWRRWTFTSPAPHYQGRRKPCG